MSKFLTKPEDFRKLKEGELLRLVGIDTDRYPFLSTRKIVVFEKICRCCEGCKFIYVSTSRHSFKEVGLLKAYSIVFEVASNPRHWIDILRQK